MLGSTKTQEIQNELKIKVLSASLEQSHIKYGLKCPKVPGAKGLTMVSRGIAIT